MTAKTDTEQEWAEFEAWWEKEGQYCRAGGGDYEKTFAYRAYQAGLAALQSKDREDVLVQAIQEAIALLGPEAPSCSGCEYEWNHALRVLHEAIDHARRVEGEGEWTSTLSTLRKKFGLPALNMSANIGSI